MLRNSSARNGEGHLCIFEYLENTLSKPKGHLYIFECLQKVCSLDTLIPTTSPSLKRKTSENDQSKQLTAAQMLWHFEVCQSNGFEENSEKPSATPLRS